LYNHPPPAWDIGLLQVTMSEEKAQTERTDGDEERSVTQTEKEEGSRKRERSNEQTDSVERSKQKPRRKSSSKSSSSDSSDSDSSSSASSDSDKEKKRKKKRRDKERKREKRKRREKEKKERKKRKKEKEKEKERKKHKKDKKKKKDKKEKKEKKREKDNRVVSQWGKYGVVREADMFLKEQEFAAYLREVKKISAEALSLGERKKYWKDYMEDYNTGTMPSKKYYNLEKWEAKERMKRLKQLSKQQPSGGYDDEGGELLPLSFNDEEAIREQRRKQREEAAFANAYRNRVLEKKMEEIAAKQKPNF
jgi:hypothetical protein